MEIATLGGGCFWCLEAALKLLDGVERVTSGYAGGNIAQPTYRQVCAGTTGHAEVVQVAFDPDKLDYRSLLEAFFAIHDPTTLDRQGHDIGTQYRSVIFYHNDAQKQAAEQLMADLTATRVYDSRIVTEVTPFTNFYAAEDAHQEYFRRNRLQPYCMVVINPKLAKFRKEFAGKLKA